MIHLGRKIGDGFRITVNVEEFLAVLVRETQKYIDKPTGDIKVSELVTSREMSEKLSLELFVTRGGFNQVRLALDAEPLVYPVVRIDGQGNIQATND